MTVWTKGKSSPAVRQLFVAACRDHGGWAIVNRSASKLLRSLRRANAGQFDPRVATWANTGLPAMNPQGPKAPTAAWPDGYGRQVFRIASIPP